MYLKCFLNIKVDCVWDLVQFIEDLELVQTLPSSSVLERLVIMVNVILRLVRREKATDSVNSEVTSEM